MNVNDIIASPTIIDVSAHCIGNGVAPVPHIPVADVYMKDDINMPDFDGKRWVEHEYVSVNRRIKRPRAIPAGIPSITHDLVDEIENNGFTTIELVVKHPNKADRLVKMRVNMDHDKDEDEDVELEPFVKVRVTPL